MNITEVVDQKVIRELCRPNDLKAWSDLLLRISGEALLFGLAIFFLDNSLCITFIFFYCASVWHGFWGYAGIGHELFHGRVFRNLTLNRILYHFASYFTWNNPSFFKKSHGYHHRFTFDSNDGEALSKQDWRPVDLIWYFTCDVPFMCRRLFYVLVNSVGRIPKIGKWVKLDWSMQRDAIAILGFNLAVQALLLMCFNDWRVNLLWFLLPFTGQIFNRLLAQSQHIGLSSLKSEGPLKHSRSLRLPWLIEFLYAGMNFHAEHHLAPGVPYYRLKELHAILIEKRLLTQIHAWRYFQKDIWMSIRQLKSL